MKTMDSGVWKEFSDLGVWFWNSVWGVYIIWWILHPLGWNRTHFMIVVSAANYRCLLLRSKSLWLFQDKHSQWMWALQKLTTGFCWYFLTKAIMLTTICFWRNKCCNPEHASFFFFYLMCFYMVTTVLFLLLFLLSYKMIKNQMWNPVFV